MNKRFAMLRLSCSALRILKRLQHITHERVPFIFGKSHNLFCVKNRLWDFFNFVDVLL
ncbi:MAG: hypothetical protein LBH59_03380 [Planctomycetaceae bacterium]|nr:hypothetical protein [Planctomycetaceae bacterium]